LKSKKRIKSEKMVLMIAVLNRIAFDNIGRPVYLDTKTRDGVGKAAYSTEEDCYSVILNNILSNEYNKDSDIIGLAAHEVRHRVQRIFPAKVLTREFLDKYKILLPDALSQIEELNSNVPNADISHELDSMVIEELFRNIFSNIELENKNLDFDLCKKILLCDEENFINLYLKIKK
jgi:hypothetical protein